MTPGGGVKVRVAQVPDRRCPRLLTVTGRTEHTMTENKLKKPRRRRADSKEAAVEDMLNGERVITPPLTTLCRQLSV